MNENSLIGNDTLIEILELDPREIYLLKSLRSRFKYGEITIVMKDGFPIRWKRITEFDEPK